MSTVDIDREERRSASLDPLPMGPWDDYPSPKEYEQDIPKGAKK